MPTVGVEKLVELQKNPQSVRNICILAHVDHGKTSLTDSLIATNGIISTKLAGKIRYLDSRPDEQLRGITMESSAISLFFSMQSRASTEQDADAGPTVSEYLVNLIDSPGHVDFQFEVSTASRLCDGAVVLVDVVEGVGSQTVAVLRQAWMEKLQTVLVINKMDRLITELKLTPAEAYAHLKKLIEQVNAVVGGFVLGDRMEEDLRWRERLEKQAHEGSADDRDPSEFVETDDGNVYFSPENNNVIFSSAIDGWAFTIKQFAHIWSRKTKMSRAVLEKTLWGDYFLDMKANKVLTSKQLKGRKSLKPMFVQLILESIWSVYQTVGTEGALSQAQIDKLKTISPAVTPSMIRSGDRGAITKAAFSTWLPLSTALLVTVVQHLPSPDIAQAARAPEILADVPGTEAVDPAIRQSILDFDTKPGAPVVAYVSKMVAIPESELLQNQRREKSSMTAEEARELARQKRAEFAKLQAEAEEGEGNGDKLNTLVYSLATTTIEEEKPVKEEPKVDDPEHLIGFARLYSGTLSVGDTVYAIPPKYSPADPTSPRPVPVTIKQLYLLMGRSMEPIDRVPAGVVVGIEGLEGAVLKSGTLCSIPDGAVNLAGLAHPSRPIVRVALEPANPADLDKLINGLKLLVQADPCAEFEFLDSGEYVICCAGELHLERCMNDLTDRYAKCEIQQGEPIVPFRETIVMPPPETDEGVGKESAQGRIVVTNRDFELVVSVKPLPVEITDFLLRHSRALKRVADRSKVDEGKQDADGGDGSNPVTAAANHESGDACSPDVFRSRLQQVLQSLPDRDQEAWTEALGSNLGRIVTFGPRRIGPNILIDATGGQIFQHPFLSDSASASAQSEQKDSSTDPARRLADKIPYAFQLALAQGPLCNEPIQGIAVFVEAVSPRSADDGDDSTNDSSTTAATAATATTTTANTTTTASTNTGRLTSDIIRSVRDSIHKSFLSFSPRLLLATYRLDIQATTDVLGRVYAVVTRRHGHVVDEYMQEGSSSGSTSFTVVAKMPVVEAFGLVEEIRKRTSGAASAQCVFDGFEVLDQDPFWVPKTEEEIEDLGETAERENGAKRYMDQVRARKGLFVAGVKLVENAEKQSTLKR